MTRARPATKPTSERRTAPSGKSTHVVTPRPVETAPAGAVQTAIEIDPHVYGGRVQGRFDLTIRGSVTCSLQIEDLALRAGGRVISRMRFGHRGAPSPDPTVPGNAPVRHRFQFTLPRPADQAAGRCPFQIIARTRDGQEYEQDFELAVELGSDRPSIAVIAGVTGTPSSESETVSSGILYVERAEFSASGTLQVDGWAVSATAVVIVQIFVDGERVGSAKLGGERADVAGVYPAYANSRSSGFTLNAPLPNPERTPHEIRVEMLCLEGFGYELTVPLERPLHDPIPAPASASREIRMFFDNVSVGNDGYIRVTGWAVCAAGVGGIAILIDEQPVGSAELGLERRDVGKEYAHIPAARYSGFRFERKVADRIRGEHTIRVVVRNGLGDERAELTTVIATEPDPRPVPVADDIPTPEADNHEFKFELDNPPLVAGVVVEPISGRLTIEGWALGRSGIAGIDIHLDDQRLGQAHYGLARQDVGAAFPEWNNSVRSGYAFHCPPRSLRDGTHQVRLTIRAGNGQEMVRSFRIDVKKTEGHGDSASIRRRVSRVEADLFADRLNRLDHQPDFMVLLPQGGIVEPDKLRRTLASLQNQAIGAWRVRILTDTAEAALEVRQCVQTASEITDRTMVISPDDTAWGACLAAPDDPPSMSYMLLYPGDELGADALAELAMARGLHPDADFIYADEARTSPVSREQEPFFKPDFSPDLLLSTNYIGRPWVMSGTLLRTVGATPASLAEAGEYDLVLRSSEQAKTIHHVARLLCQRGTDEIDNADRSQAALVSAVDRRGLAADVVPSVVPGTWRVKRRVGVTGKVSIIIPTCAAHGYIETCITTLRQKTAYGNFEIICIDSIPDSEQRWKDWLRQNADKVVDIPEAFNWSTFNNRAASVADGDYLLFLNDDIEFEQEDWLDVLLEHAQRPEVAIVGPQLLYPDRKVQHAGMFLTNNGIARHAFRFAHHDEPGYFGLALTQRNVIAVTGACMLMRRQTFNDLGCFDEAHQIVNNDLDFCLRAHRAGLLTVFTPYATLIHHELASREKLKDVFDVSHFTAAWGTLFAAGDPYFNPYLSRHADDYRPDDEPIEVVHAGNPLFGQADIKRILVVKLDHIGDFIIAIPSIRRLKELFPAASVSVLAGRASQAFATAENGIDEFLEFEFFHARSGLGQKVLTQDDYLALRERLRPHRFDLAIDLRKQPDTRDVLRYTGGRYLAGFENLGQFPFLDIASEWEGDQSLHRKRSHVVDDLLSLVETVGKAARSDRTQIVLPAGASEAALAGLPDDARALFARPVVAIHPGVGTIMRQWPAEHFAALIDLLSERDGVNAVLIGGPDEAEVATAVLAEVTRPGTVVSLVGKTPLRDLPGLLAACDLYVGNNSGPKHIAAALGVPTIGIHSGVVDAIEWGPVGKRAVALRRNMACSPCYLARLEDCPRGLACLRSLDPTLVHQSAEMLLAKTVPPAALATLPLLHIPLVRPETRVPNVLDANIAADFPAAVTLADATSGTDATSGAVRGQRIKTKMKAAAIGADPATAGLQEIGTPPAMPLSYEMKTTAVLTRDKRRSRRGQLARDSA